MKVLVIGGGGREHAIVWKLSQSSKVDKIYCAPGNGGTAEIAQNVPIPVHDQAALVQFAKEEGIDMTVVGPEDPLLAGIVDVFTKSGLAIFGPTSQAAQIEGSKSFAKDLMKRYNIPTAAYETFTDYSAALAYVRQQGAPIVIKADGLAAGKGVVVAETLEEAELALMQMMQDEIFGQAGARVVVEECLRGEELTLLAFVDGETVKPMITSQDHKAAYDGDKGPNTGGMGTYAPVPHMSTMLVDQVVETIVKPMAKAMVKEGYPFTGVLYTGLMITAEGPKVIEFNARFGDPETQVVLPLLQSDLAEIFLAAINGTLADIDVKWSDGSAVCVVMAAEGYPAGYRKGDLIEGLNTPVADSVVFHAGTKLTDAGVVTNGGRVLGVTGFAPTLAEAKQTAYRGVEAIRFNGAFCRKDIADKALRHM